MTMQGWIHRNLRTTRRPKPPSPRHMPLLSSAPTSYSSPCTTNANRPPAGDPPQQQQQQGPDGVASNRAGSLPAGLKCGSVDDEKWLTKMYKSILFEKHLGVTHPAVLCNTPENIKAAVDVILGHKTPDLESACEPPLDIITLDQHLGRGPRGGEMMYGTKLASELQRRGFQGQ